MGLLCWPDDLPPHAQAFALQISDGASSTIRERIFKRPPFADLVTAEVCAYVERYGLYRGRTPNTTTRFCLERPLLLFFADQRNPRSLEVVAKLERYVDYQDPNCIVVVGGDGTMLRAIKKHWRRRLPFFGLNTGHLGFLLNEIAPDVADRFEPGELSLHQLPMLYVEMDGIDGETRRALAFNDAWLERGTSQSLWAEVKVSGVVRIPQLVADGLLVSTAGGFTAYARSMGAPPLLIDTPGWLLVGSNVMDPSGWNFALLSMEADAEIVLRNSFKRPAVAFVDSQAFGEITAMRVRLSRLAAAELAFPSTRDIAEKIAAVQFPRFSAFPQRAGTQ